MPVYKIEWLPEATQDVVRLRQFIKNKNPGAAKKAGQRILRPGRVPNTKELVVDRTPFILPYRVRDNKIEILRVLHTSRRWPKKI